MLPETTTGSAAIAVSRRSNSSKRRHISSKQPSSEGLNTYKSCISRHNARPLTLSPEGAFFLVIRCFSFPRTYLCWSKRVKNGVFCCKRQFPPGCLIALKCSLLSHTPWSEACGGLPGLACALEGHLSSVRQQTFRKSSQERLPRWSYPLLCWFVATTLVATAVDTPNVGAHEEQVRSYRRGDDVVDLDGVGVRERQAEVERLAADAARQPA